MSYLEDVLKRVAAENIKPGRVYDLNILHDDWCDLINGKGPCNCEPTVSKPKIRPKPIDN